MSLDEIISGRKAEPPRFVIYGTQGIGKSSLVSEMPDPIFIQTENGLNEIDCDKFPLAHEYDQVIDHLKELLGKKHKYKTLGVDSLDWMQKLIFQKVALIEGRDNVDQIGYQAGYKMALQYWDEFFYYCDLLHSNKRMMIAQIAHEEIKTFQSPDCDPYDRYQLALHKHGAKRAIQWADAVLFINYRIATSKLKTPKGDVIRASGGDARIIFTREKPAYIAKNRYGFPDEIPYEQNKGWLAISKYLKKPKKTEASNQELPAGENSAMIGNSDSKQAEVTQ